MKRKHKKQQRSESAISHAPPERISLPPGSLDGPLGPVRFEKRFRISWDFSVAIRDIDPQSIGQHLVATCRQHGQESDGLALVKTVEAQAEMQRKLVQSLLTDPELLEQYLLNAVAEPLIEDAQDNMIAEGGSPEVLAPAIATLSPKERQYLEDAADDDLFDENTEHLQRAVEISSLEFTFEEVDEDS